MTPKEMALHLFDIFNDEIPSNDSIDIDKFMQRDIIASKKCALIAVKYIIRANPHSNPFNTTGYSSMTYWYEVQEEIEKL